MWKHSHLPLKTPSQNLPWQEECFQRKHSSREYKCSSPPLFPSSPSLIFLESPSEQRRSFDTQTVNDLHSRRHTHTDHHRIHKHHRLTPPSRIPFTEAPNRIQSDLPTSSYYNNIVNSSLSLLLSFPTYLEHTYPSPLPTLSSLTISYNAFLQPPPFHQEGSYQPQSLHCSQRYHEEAPNTFQKVVHSEEGRRSE